MIVTCPSCEAQYILPDETVGAKGRRVKCTTCAFVWLQAPVGMEKPAIAATPDPVAAAMASLDLNMGAARSVFGPALFGAGTACVLFALTLGFLTLVRDELVIGWPSSVVLFDKMGVDVTPAGAGLALSDIKVEMFPDKTPPLMTFRGSIKNTTDQSLALPKMAVMNSGDGGVLKDWSIDLYGKKLGAGDAVAFDYTLQDAPGNTRDVTVRFTH